jgi:hypothetical protein
MIFDWTISLGGTFLNLMKMMESKPTLAPDTSAWSQRESEPMIKNSKIIAIRPKIIGRIKY